MPPTCDAGLMQSIEARADLEAQREVVQAESMIKRADSVLAYSCFDQFLRYAAATSGKSLSENPGLGAAADTESLDNALQGMAGDALGNYTNNNFSHAFAGGEVAPANEIDSDTSGSDSYNCENMNAIWAVASCDPVGEGDDPNAFFTFAEYAALEDARNNDTIDGVCAPPKWEEIADIANGETPWQTGEWKDEQSQSYFDLMDPENCSKISPIKTGVRITIQGGDTAGETFDDAVCSSPGCYYDGAAKCSAEAVSALN